MELCRSLRWFMVVMLVVAGCQKPAPSAPTPPKTNAPSSHLWLDHAQPRLETIKVWLGKEELQTEVALRPQEIATGMMWRTNMTDAEAMLFVFAKPDRREFYMLNCVVSLSAAYIDAEGVIDEIIDLRAGVPKPVPSRSQHIKYVLEVPQGWFARHHVNTGMVVNTSLGPLKNFRGVWP